MLPVDYTTLFNSHSFNLVGEIVSGWAQRRRWFAAFQNAVTRQICEHLGQRRSCSSTRISFRKCILYMKWKKTTDCIWGFAKCNNNNNCATTKRQHAATYTLVEFWIKWIHWSSLCRLFYLHQSANVKGRARALARRRAPSSRSFAKCPFIWHLVWFTNVWECECYATSSYGKIFKQHYSNVLETSFPLTKQLIRWKTRFISLTFARY